MRQLFALKTQKNKVVAFYVFQSLLLTTNLADVSTCPKLFVIRHVKTPESSS